MVPVNTDDAANPLKLLQVIEPVPKALAQEAERVRSGVRDYRELTLLRQGLKQLYQACRTNPMDFFVGHEVYDHLEKVVDRFDDVANEIHGIVIDHV